jgi:hypothetical protein
MFQTDDSWERTSERDVLRSLFSQPGLRRHPLIEVAQNVPLFHVDVLLEGEAEEHGFWARFVGTDLATVMHFLNDNDIAKSRISVQTAHAQTDEYRIRLVHRIYEVRRYDGATIYGYECENGERVFEHQLSPHAHVEGVERVAWASSDRNQ